jgi:hypothetical protein
MFRLPAGSKYKGRVYRFLNGKAGGVIRLNAGDHSLK